MDEWEVIYFIMAELFQRDRNDVITFVDGEVFINGKLCVEDYIADEVETNSYVETLKT